MREKPNLSLYIKEISKARRVAEKIGYRVPRGIRAGDGNISGVLSGMASGEVVVVRISDFDNGQILEILNDIARYAENAENPETKKFFGELGESLEFALGLRI